MRRQLVLQHPNGATHQLLQIPPADAHLVVTALVLIQAFCESLGIGFAVPPVGHILIRAAILSLAMDCRISSSLRRLARTTTEEAADCVPDGRADGYTTVVGIDQLLGRGRGMHQPIAYAAVEAIWPKRPEPPLVWACCTAGGCAAVLVLRDGCWGGVTLGRAGATVGRDGALRAGAAERPR